MDNGAFRTAEITISGRVQGVGFRYAALRAAQTYGIRGFVRNLPSGQVFVIAQGSPPALGQFIDWCKTGPRMARVDQVDVADRPFTNLPDFCIQ